MGIKRWYLYVDDFDYARMCECDKGEYILYSDHFVEMADKDADQDRLCDTLRASESTIAKQSEKIAELQLQWDAGSAAHEELRGLYAELQAKCERMEAALRNVMDSPLVMYSTYIQTIARTALTETK